jgi:hypothetical protein
MKFIPLTVFLTTGLLLLSSCKDSEDVKEETDILDDTYVCPSPQENTPEMYSVSSKADTILGRGYDIMGNFLAATNMKECVIDVPDSEIIRIGYLKSDVGAYAGSDANNYLQNIMYANGFSGSVLSTERKLFTGSIKDYYGKNPFGFSTAYQFAGKDVFFTRTILKMPVTVFMNMKYRSKYLTEQFKQDLNILTPNQLILKYGTHVLCNAFVGIRIHGITNCVVADDKENAARDAFYGFSARMIRSIGLTNLDIYYKEKDSLCTGGTLHLDFNGGQVNKVKYINDKETTVTADYHEWWNSNDIDMEHFALTELHKEDLIPLYEFIADSTKKSDVKKAIEQYITDNQIEEEEMLPLFQALIGSHHSYFTSYEDVQETTGINASDSRKCKSPLGLIYKSKKSGTVPLYCYSNGKNDRLTTSDILGDAGIYQKAGILGYVLTKPVQSEAYITVYEIWNGTNDYAYTTENQESYGSKGTWKKTGNLFYIVKL